MTSLNGFWDFGFVGELEEYKGIEQVSFNTSLPVPGCFDLEPGLKLRRGIGVYKTSVVIGGKVTLRFDGMGPAAKIYWDGKEICDYVLPFSCEECRFDAGEEKDFTFATCDLNMAEYIKDMIDIGVKSLKVEGRMKSIYYVAMVTRAYRKALDALAGKITNEEASPFIQSLEEVAHRESTTGFYYSRANADETTVGASDSPYILAGTIEEKYTEEQINFIDEVPPASNIIKVIDRDDRSQDEINDLIAEGIKVLARRHLECYLLDDEVLEKWCHSVGKSDKVSDMLQIKTQKMAESVLPPFLYTAVQAFLSAGWTKSRKCIRFSKRGFANAFGCSSRYLAETIGSN